MKKICLVLPLFLFAFVFYPSIAQAQTCDPNIKDALTHVGHAQAQLSHSAYQSHMRRPDSIANLTCLDKQMQAAAISIGTIFTDNPAFMGCNVDVNFPQYLQNAVGRGMQFYLIDKQYGLAGGLLMLGSRAFQEPISKVSGAISNAIGGLANSVSGGLTNALSSLFGGLFGGFGRCIVSNVIGPAISATANAVTAPLNNILGSQGCNNMTQVWEATALQNMDINTFLTLRDVATGGDPRLLAGIPFNFNSNGAQSIFQRGVDSTNQLKQNSAVNIPQPSCQTIRYGSNNQYFRCTPIPGCNPAGGSGAQGRCVQQ